MASTSCGTVVLTLLIGLSFDLVFASRFTGCTENEPNGLPFLNIPHPDEDGCTTGSCEVAGDPYLITFDCLKYEYMGKCSSYTLVKTCKQGNNEQLKYFEIEAEFDKMPFFERKSLITKLTIKIDNLKIELSGSDDITLNGIQIPESNRVFTIGSVIRYCNAVVVSMKVGLNITWSPHRALIQVDKPGLAGNICGLCGNYNGKKYDDFTTRENERVSNVVEFGDSWGHDECAPCDDCDDTTCIPANSDKVDLAKAICVIFKNGRIPACGEHTAESLYQQCMDIMCASLPENEGLCEFIEKTIAVCTDTELLVPMDLSELCGPGPGCFVGEVFIPIDDTVLSTDCSENCTCKSAGNVVCQPRSGCNENEVCEVRDNFRKCHCKSGFYLGSDGVCYERTFCYVCGDPHFLTFDGVAYNYQGNCSYIIVQTTIESSHSFEIVGDFESVESRPTVTALKFVRIYVYDLVIQFSYNSNDVLVDDVNVHVPFYHDTRLSITRSGMFTVLETDFGLQMIWDARHCTLLLVRLPKIEFLDKVNGLCGHLSGDTSDDFTDRNGDIETDVNKFGDSWAYDVCEPCTPETCLNEDPCIGGTLDAAIADQVCNFLKDVSGPFKMCLEKIDSTQYWENCRYDICADPDNRKAACIYYEKLAADCRLINVNIDGWRNGQLSLCDYQCDPETETFTECGTACPATCVAPHAYKYCTMACVPGCQCKRGLLRSGDSCVEESQCGCQITGVYTLNGEKFVNDDCTLECRCESGAPNCTDTKCHEKAECRAENNKRGCFCKPNYTGNPYKVCLGPCDQPTSPCFNGGHCIDAEEKEHGFICRCPQEYAGEFCTESLMLCYASGDPHYKNFDGKRFDFQGKCDYVLTQSCDLDLADFKVVVHNVVGHSPKVSVTRRVTLFAFGERIVLDQGNVVKINDGPQAILPIHNVNYDVYYSGQFVVVRTSFDLIVQFNGISKVKVSVPTSFKDKICGLCGNGNGNQADDFINPDGDAIFNRVMWGHSWATNKDVCNMCADNDPDCTVDAHPCDTVSNWLKADAEKDCGLLTAKTGYEHVEKYDVNLASEPLLTKTMRHLYPPKKLGCYNDTKIRALDGVGIKKYAMSQEVCFDLCKKYGNHRYAGLQNGNECFCGAPTCQYGRYGEVPEEKCNKPCGLNPYQKCGALFKNLVFDLGTGPFVECHKEIKPTAFFDDCLYDYCSVQRAQLCDDIADYADECQSQGITIGNWRSLLGGGKFCEFECPMNSHYNVTASPCQPTCAKPVVGVCTQLYKEGCLCNEGFIWKGPECVLTSDCE